TQEAYQAVVDHSLQGLVVVQDMKVVFANQAMAEISGYGVEEILAFSAEMLEAFVHPEDREKVWKSHQARLYGESLPDRYAFRVVRKGGEVRWLEIHTSRVEYKGRPAIQAACIDVTDRAHTEESLRDSERRNRALLDAMPDLIFRLDAHGRFLDYKTGEDNWLYVPPEQFLGRTVADVMPAETAAIAMSRLEQVFADAQTRTVEYQLPTPDGQLHDFECRLVACGDREALAVVRDVGERKHAERLGQLQRDVAVKLSSFSNLQEGLQYCLEAAVAASQMDCGGIYSVNDTGAFELRVHLGLSADFVEVSSFHAADSRPAQIAMQGQPLYTTYEALGLPLEPVQRAEGFVAVAVIPIRDEGRVVACMNVASRSADEVLPWSRLVLETIAAQMGSAISRLKAREALQHSERRFRSLIEHTTDAVFCYEYDPPIETDLPVEEQVERLYDGVLVECNDVCARSYGASRATDVVGKRLTDLFGTMPGSLDELFRTMIQAGYQACDGEGVEKLPDGRERHYLNNGYGVVADGKLLRVWGTFRDVTDRVQAQRRLRELQEVVNRSPVLVFVWRVVPGQWPVEFVSSNVEQVLGYTADDFAAGRICWVDITHPDDLSRLEAEVAHYLERGQYEWSQEYRLITKSGQVRWFTDQNLALADDDGQVARIQSIVLDITDRKQAQEALQESEAKFRNLAEQSPNMIFINVGGRVVYANQRCEDVMGYTREEFYGPDFDFQTLMAPECRDPIRNSFRRHMKGENVPSVEYALVTRDGRRIEAILTTKLISYEGSSAILGIVTDITDRKRAEERLQESETRLRAAIENLPFDFFLLDKTGRYAMINAACREHWGDVVGKSLEEVCPDERTLALWQSNNSRAFAGEVIRDDVVLTPQGREGYYHNIISPIRRGEEIQGILGVNIDITERKEAEEALRYRLDFEEMVAGVSNAFVNLPADDIDCGINQTLETVGRFVDVDRTYVVMLHDDGARLSQVHEWCAEGIESYKDRAQGFEMRWFPWTVEEFLERGVLNVPDVEALQGEATRARELMEAAGVKSLLNIPIVIGGALFGFLGFAALRRRRTWSLDEVSLVKIVAEVFANALERKRSAEALKERLAFETLLSTLSATFVNLPVGEIDAEIECWLGRIGEFLEIDRGTVVQASDGHGDIEVTHAWAAEGLNRAPATLPRDTFRWFLDQLPKGRTMAFARLEDAPAELAGEREYCVQQGMKSVVVIPVTLGESILSAVVFASMREHRTWSDELVQRLRLVGEIFANALLRKRAEEALRREHRLVSRLMETSPAGIVRVDAGGNTTFANPCAEKMLGLSKGEITQRTYNASQWRITDYAGAPFPDEELPFSRVMRTSKPVYDVRHAISAADGTRTLLRINAAPLFDEAGAVEGMVATIEDITEMVKAEESLRASEERFRNIFEHAVLGFYQTTPEGRLLAANPSLVRMLGYSCFDEIADLNVEQEGFQQGYSRQDFKERIESRGRVMGLESAWRRRDGTTLMVRENARAVRDEEGRTLYYEGTVEDITEWKRAERALRESERRYRELYEGSRDGTVSADLEGRILDCNSVFLNMLGYSLDEIRGMKHEDFTPARWHAFERDVIQSQVLTRDYSDVYEKEYVCKDGTIFPVELRAYLDRDGEGRPVGMWALVRDITERKKAEAALRASERNYREIFNAANEAIFVHDPLTGAILDVNETTVRMLGYSRREILQRTVGELSADEPAYSQQKALERVAKAAGENTQLFEWLLRRKDGSRLWVEVNLKSAVIGGQRRVLAVVRDIADRKQAEDEEQRHLSELTRAWHANTLGEMASGLAHELNQPLCAILNYSSGCLRMTRREHFSVEVVRSSIEQISGQAERAANIIKHIRSLMAKRDPHRATLDLNALVVDVMDMLRSAAAKRGAVMISRFAHDLPAVEGNAVELEQVVLNLLRNALEAMNDPDVTQRKLTVSTSRRPDGTVQVAVCDTGRGFSAELAEKMFDSFFTTKEEGLGIGLSLSRRIIEAHGGRLRAESDGASGAAFTFTLPFEGVDRGK
ncbi:MAG: PAS domain S-box protein, partial [Sedimentisphaerales bacterium]|nr:PAS domain S-box protein [Sedimentisphaerales bacterium]